MTASVSMRRYTGVSAGTESAAQTTVELSADDALTGADVAPGSRSFEAWLRLRVDVAPDMGVANFWLMNTGDLPDGVSLLFGVVDEPQTPVATVSQIATMVLQPGRRYIWDASVYVDVGSHSRYLVIQEAVDIGASSGAIDPQSLSFGWVER